MSAGPRPVGVLGGTFDPIHHGHLRPALEVLEALGLAELRFVPCRIPAHRATPSVSAEQRLDLVRLATAEQAGFVADDRELRRPGPSYMIDTLASLRTEFGDTPLVLIVGSDAFRELHTWRRWRELTDLAHIAIMRRPGPVAAAAAGSVRGLAPDQRSGSAMAATGRRHPVPIHHPVGYLRHPDSRSAGAGPVAPLSVTGTGAGPHSRPGPVPASAFAHPRLPLRNDRIPCNSKPCGQS